MPNINEFSSITSLSASDKLLAWSNENGDTRKVSLATLMAYVESQFASPDFDTVITAPTSSGFNIIMPAYSTSIWEIINPTGTFAAGTLTLPAPADCFDGQQVVVCTTQIITAFTLNGNGATTVGVPTSLGAGGFFTIRFNALQSTWYCTSQNVVSTFTTLTLTSGINDSNGNELLKVVATGAAVNELTLANAATGNAPSLSATGNDPNIAINLVSKGTETVKANGVEVATTTGVQTLSSKSFIAPILGTPASGTLTNCTGLPVSGVSGMGAGVATFLATPSSANLKTAVTDETGSGALVFANGPALDQPTMAAPTILATTVANLPGPIIAIGARSTVTDSNAALAAGHGNIVAGGGANIVPVYSDGTDWRIG